MIERKIVVPVEISSEEAAFEFCSWDDKKQAEFFNEISRLSELWERPFCFQLQYITDCEALTSGGRNVMESIGQYAKEE